MSDRAPTCPHCGHEMTTDEMLGHPDGLFDIAPNEGTAEIECPNVMCGKTYWVQGGYVPTYTSATSEDDL